MGIICAAPPKRPKTLECASLCELYSRFEELFLCNEGVIDSCCEHTITVFDHNFFHLAKVDLPGKPKILMNEYKEAILACKDGFGCFQVEISRAKYLTSAIETFKEPNEVWEGNKKATARWVYVKEYDSPPYPFSIGLVTERESGLLVPMSSFPCKRGDVKKWRNGILIYP